MFRNNLLIALRTLRKNAAFTLINISGLAIGICASLVIYLIVQHEMSYEANWPEGDRIYRVTSDMTFAGGEKFPNSGVAMPLPKAIRQDMTGFDAVTHFVTWGASVKVGALGPNGGLFKSQPDLALVDEEYFKLFPYVWLAGKPDDNLKEPHQTVLSEERARAYFGNIPATEILGKTLTYSDSVTATVTGVVKVPVGPTAFNFKEFISYATVETTSLKDQFNGTTEWNSVSSNSQCWVKLKPGVRPGQFESLLPALRRKYVSEKEHDATVHHLQSLYSMHWDGQYDAFDTRQSSKKTMWGLLAVGLFLLLLGCINFINLTTAQSAQRAKEIGIRKTMGGTRGSLIGQFLSETFILTVAATALSLALLPLLLQVFKDFIPPGISFSSVYQWHVIIFMVLLIILVTLASGFYPSMVLSRFNPVSVLKNQAHGGTATTRRAWLRTTLTVAQFVIAQFLVIATLIVGKQVRYSLNKDLGYRRDAIITFYAPYNFFANEKDLKRFVLEDKLRSMPEVEAVSIASGAPASFGTSSSTFKYVEGKEPIELMVETKYGDSTYFNMFGMKLLSGRFPRTSDTTNEYVINATYARALGFMDPNAAVGHNLGEGTGKKPIVGVLADFHSKSTHTAIKPIIFSCAREHSHMFNVRFRPQGQDLDLWKRGVAKVEKAFKELYTDSDFSYTFFDDDVAKFYKEDQDLGHLLGWATGLAIFISCLGLLGLVMYTTNLRTKEIGVRKVLGASVTQIVSLLSKELLLLVFIAFVIAAPLAWWAMHRWLDGFVYRTGMSWWIFAACGVGTLLLALAIMAIRTVKAAISNPVGALRSE
jgi:putative ABC transport system permease protein